jgi:signal peptidase II
VPARAKSVSSGKAESAEADASAAQSFSGRVAFLVLALGGVTLDLLTKHFIFQWRTWERLGHVSWLIEPYFGIQTSTNPGALFGLGGGYRVVFITLSFLALGVIGYFVFVRRQPIDSWLTLALGLVTGGILGNLYDRLGLWHTKEAPLTDLYGVRDWIHFDLGFVPFDPWPNFNVADCCLVVGACLLALHSLRPEPKTLGPEKAAGPKAESGC